MRSENHRITVDWFVLPNVDEAAIRSALRNFIDQRSLIGPPPRLELPDSHPDQSDYVYDPASTFRYLDLVVGIDGDHHTVQSDYGKDLAGAAGAGGPLKPWTEFVSVLLAEIDKRGSTA